MVLTEEDQAVLGKEAASAFLVLALAAEETMQLLHLWLMAMEPHPTHPLFRKVAHSRSHMLLRLVNLKVHEANSALGGFQKALKRRGANGKVGENAKRLQAIWNDGLREFNDGEFFGLSYEMRRKMGAHCGTTDVESWMENAPKNSERRFLFHTTKANSLFPAVDDLVFSAFLNSQFERAYGSGSNQQKFERFLSWLAEAANATVVTFHKVSVVVFFQILGKDAGNMKAYELERGFIGDSVGMELPLHFVRKDQSAG